VRDGLLPINRKRQQNSEATETDQSNFSSVETSPKSRRVMSGSGS